MKYKYHSLLLSLWLILIATYTYSKGNLFQWQITQNGNRLLSGTLTHNTGVSQEMIDTGCESQAAMLGCLDRSCVICTNGKYCIYTDESQIIVNVLYSPFNHRVPSPFSNLLNNHGAQITHSFNTGYVLQGDVTSNLVYFSSVLCCVSCCCCYLALLYSNPPIVQETDRRYEEIKNATPDSLPSNVVIRNRYLSHTVRDQNNIVLSQSSLPGLESDVLIFDLFLTTPTSQHWLTNNLGSNINLPAQVVIPELLETPSSSMIALTSQTGMQINNEISLTHQLTFSLNNGMTIEYHLNNSVHNTIQILAIIISHDGYTLSINSPGYEISQNDPPPPYSEVICNCPGACNCATMRQNDTDDSDEPDKGNYKPHFMQSTDL